MTPNDDDLGEPVNVPPAVKYGAFHQIGQEYDGETVTFTRDGGLNAKSEPEPCSEIKLKLLKDTIVYRNDETIPLPAGSEITITGGPWMLNKGLLGANPQVGQRIKIVFEGMQGKSKVIKVYPGKPPKPRSGADDSPPPF